MNPQHLVLLVEGYGDVAAAPILLKRLLREHQAFDVLVPDSVEPMRVGELAKLIKNDFGEWRRFLGIAAKRRNVGACMLLLDGDSPAKFDRQQFCAMTATQRLAFEARKVVAGIRISVAIVFPCMEFESWLIAGATSLVGRRLSDGRQEIVALPERMPEDPETAPRDAKGWFRGIMQTGYKPSRDQAELTKLVDLDLIRQKKMRSFQRLESAVQELVAAVRSGQCVVTPSA